MPARRSLATKGVSVVDLSRHVEPALGGDLLAALGHEAARMRLHLQRDRKHLVRHRHFEIERGELGGGQPRDVLIPDVTAILAEMRGDVVGAGLDRELRRAQRDRDIALPAHCAASPRDRC